MDSKRNRNDASVDAQWLEVGRVIFDMSEVLADDSLDDDARRRRCDAIYADALARRNAPR